MLNYLRQRRLLVGFTKNGIDEFCVEERFYCGASGFDEGTECEWELIYKGINLSIAQGLMCFVMVQK